MNGTPRPALEVRSGTPVEVRTRFDGRWARGFEVIEAVRETGAERPRYRLRRLSDGATLSLTFSPEELRLVVALM